MAEGQKTPLGKVWAVPFEPQVDAVQKHCFGDCGKISMAGAISMMECSCYVCCEPTCPHLAKETDEPVGKSQWTGDDVYLRAVKL